MAKKSEPKVSKFENTSVVKLKFNGRQVKLLSRHERKDSVYISWHAEYYGTTNFDEEFIVREDDLYSED